VKLPIQPNEYSRNLEQQRSGELERAIALLEEKVRQLEAKVIDHETRIAALEP
jgi:hypothetical protein